MKRKLLLILVVVVVFGWVGTLIQRDPGYVLVTYDGMSLQTSLWVACGLFALLVGGTYLLIHFVRGLLNASGAFADWNSRRRDRKASELVSQGILLFLAGEYARARRFIEKGAPQHRAPSAGYLIAAQAADRLGDSEGREALLRLAVESDPGAAPAAALVAATMAADREDWPRCLELLGNATKNTAAGELRKRALLQRGEEADLRQALPMLRNAEDTEVLQKRLALASFEGADAESARKAFRKLAKALKHDEDVVLAYSAVVGEKEAEVTLRQALDSRWSRPMLLAWAGLGQQTLARRIDQAIAWLRSHGDDADLHLVLGMLREAAGDRDAALAEYRKSIALADSREANEGMARLLSFSGDHAGANEHLKAALRD